MDNGRSRILASEYRDTLRCIRCGACLNACPIYRTVGGHAYGSVYPGPIGALLTPLFNGLEHHADLPQATSLCGACFEACPVKIDLHHHLLQNRRNASESKPAFFERLAYKTFSIVANEPKLWQLAKKAGWFTQPLQKAVKGSALDPAKSWTKTRDLPPMPQDSFKDWWSKRK